MWLMGMDLGHDQQGLYPSNERSNRVLKNLDETFTKKQVEISPSSPD